MATLGRLRTVSLKKLFDPRIPHFFLLEMKNSSRNIMFCDPQIIIHMESLKCKLAHSKGSVRTSGVNGLFHVGIK